MREIYGDMWSQKCHAVCITTNGIVYKGDDGERRAVMGAGVARQARERFPGIDKLLASCIIKDGNRVHLLVESGGALPYSLIAFPTKHNWRDPSPIGLIVESSKQLKLLADAKKWTQVILPKPGCRNGGLRWEDVKPIIEPFLDDRFFIIDRRWS